MSLEIRKMTKEDAGAVAAMEREIFSVPWSEKSIIWHLETRHTVSLVMTDEGEIISYFLGNNLLGEGEIYRIAVSQARRKNGYGEMMLSEFMKRAESDGATTFVLEVRSKNAPAIALYKKAGFVEAGLRKNYYSLPDDDGIIMRADI